MNNVPWKAALCRMSQQILLAFSFESLKSAPSSILHSPLPALKPGELKSLLLHTIRLECEAKQRFA